MSTSMKWGDNSTLNLTNHEPCAKLQWSSYKIILRSVVLYQNGWIVSCTLSLMRRTRILEISAGSYFIQVSVALLDLMWR